MPGRDLISSPPRPTRPYTEARFEPCDFLASGRETRGLPESLLNENAEACRTIPMSNPAVRSLNLATSAPLCYLRRSGRSDSLQLGYCSDNPPNWPVVSHDSGLFHGTEETGCPLESTFSALGTVALLEQPT